MAVSYQWLVERLEAYPQKDGFSDVIFSVYWRVNGRDDVGHSATISGVQSISLNTSETFTPYEILTQDQVLGWVKAAMGQRGVADVESYLAQQIANQSVPPVALPPLPWNK